MFAVGIVPAAIAMLVRGLLHEPQRWRRIPAQNRRVAIAELFAPRHRRITLLATALALISPLTWWSCNAFIPVVASGLARATAHARGLGAAATLSLIEQWKLHATSWF